MMSSRSCLLLFVLSLGTFSWTFQRRDELGREGRETRAESSRERPECRAEIERELTLRSWVLRLLENLQKAETRMNWIAILIESAIFWRWWVLWSETVRSRRQASLFFNSTTNFLNHQPTYKKKLIHSNPNINNFLKNEFKNHTNVFDNFNQSQSFTLDLLPTAQSNLFFLAISLVYSTTSIFGLSFKFTFYITIDIQSDRVRFMVELGWNPKCCSKEESQS